MIDDSLGEGSFGYTVLIKDPFIDELFVAKKYAPKEEVDKEEYYSNFLDEIKILYRLNHPNIVRIFNYYPYEKYHTGYIIMEYVNGKNIADYIKEEIIDNGKRGLDNIFEQIIDAFCCIESNKIIHRDIRASNILITNDGTVKIIDFGIGKKIDENTEIGEVSHDSLARNINRPYTLPQEYYEEKYTIKTDMFYIGELFNRLIMVGLEDDESIFFSYKKIIEKMMKENPDERFKSFSEIQEVISKNALDRLNVSEADKKTYRSFVDSYYACIAHFSEPPQYGNRSQFIAGLEKILQENLFEDYVQNNGALVNCLVKSKYSFYNQKRIVKNKDLSNFIEWFKRYDKGAQDIIMSNIICKFNQIDVSIEYDVPF